MSPTIPLVFGLSILLVSGAAESEEMMDPFALIRETLKYWRRIYKTYQEEVILGYCWAEYFLGIEDHISNLPMPAAVLQDHFDPGSIKRDNLTTTRRIHEDTLPRNTNENWHFLSNDFEKRVRNKRSRESPNSTDLNIKIFKIVKEYLTACSDRFPDKNFSLDIYLRIVRTLLDPEFYKKSARYIQDNVRSTIDRKDVFRETNREFSPVGNDLSVPSSSSLSSLSRETQDASYDGRLSRQKDSEIVETLSDPKFEENVAEGDWKLKGGSKDLEVDTRRKLLYRKTSRGTSVVDDSFVRRMFSLQLSRGEQQKPLDARSFLRETAHREGRGSVPDKRKLNSLNSGGQTGEHPLKYYKRDSQENSRVKRDTKKQIKNHSVHFSPVSANASTLPKAPENLSKNPVSLLSKKPFKILFQSNYTFPENKLYKDHYESEFINEKKEKHTGNDPEKTVLTVADRKPTKKEGELFNSLNNNLKHFTVFKVIEYPQQKTRFDKISALLARLAFTKPWEKTEPILHPAGLPLLPRVRYLQFMGAYRDSTSGTSRNSRPRRSSGSKDQGRRSSSIAPEARGLARMLASIFIQPLMAFLRTLGLFVQVGRQIMDYVESNRVLACTNDYLWNKIINWLDS